MKNDKPANSRASAFRRAAAPLTYEIHAHENAVQIHDGSEETPLAVMTSPRGDVRALAILAHGIGKALGAKLRAFAPNGKEL